jgi:hypothetical protein
MPAICEGPRVGVIFFTVLKPEWLALILKGDKTMELQKSNLKNGKVGLAASGKCVLMKRSVTP